MKTIVKVYIHAAYEDWNKKYRMTAWSQDMSSASHCGPLVGTHEFEFDEPPYDVLVNGTIAQYREQQKKVLADAEMKSQEIEALIQELLCIEYRPAEVA